MKKAFPFAVILILFLNLSGLVVAYAQTWEKLPGGFLKMVTHGETRFGLEVPGFGIFHPPIAADRNSLISPTGNDVCPAKPWEGVFTFSKWAKENDVTLATQPAIGTFTWDPKTSEAKVTQLYNLSDFKTVTNFKAFGVKGTCDKGRITFGGEGDRGGVLTLTPNQGGVFVAQTEKVMLLLPKTAIRSKQILEGNYSAFQFESGSVSAPQLMQLTMNQGVGSGRWLADVESGKEKEADGLTLTDIKINQPADGLVTALLTAGRHETRNAACAVHAKDQVFFCTAQSFGDARKPMNFILARTSK